MANFGPILFQGTDATGKVLNLRDVVDGTNYNKVAWYTIRVDGSGAEFWVTPVVKTDGQTAPTVPVAPPTISGSNGGNVLHVASGGEVTIGIPQPFGYDEAGQRFPPVSRASHLAIYCVTAGTNATFMVKGG